MSDLKPITPLGGDAARIDRIGELTISENPNWALASLSARLGQEADAAAKAKAHLGVDLPEVGNVAIGDSHRAYWIGPESWMIMAPHDSHELLAQDIKQAVGDTASVVEQTDAWCCFDIAGETVVDLLERSCAVDARAMEPGSVTRSTIHHVGCFVMRTQSEWSILGPRSSAGSLHHALVAAAHSVA